MLKNIAVNRFFGRLPAGVGIGQWYKGVLSSNGNRLLRTGQTYHAESSQLRTSAPPRLLNTIIGSFREA